MNTTTRKFPRSLNEAFPHTADAACAIEVGHRPFWWRVARFFRSFL